MSESTPGKHPLIGQKLPDWLASVPMDAPEPKLVQVAEGKTVPSNMLITALTIEIGGTVGSFSISPELAKLFAEFTEKPAWTHLPSEPTSVTRIAEEIWEVRVGDFTGSFNRQDLEQQLTKALRRSPEEEAPGK